ncbi:CTLH/CRA C-terminal to lish motif domain-containing protein [Entophlyctis helioformis]|nr:CTLH/CRA C-terminal to lish motif domain-containing protein [Entophlyctis helioformis]
MDAISKEFERLAKRQRTLKDETNSTLDSLIRRLQDTRAAIAAGSPDASKTAKEVKEAKELAAKLTEAYKDTQATIYKYSKTVEKRFKTDLDAIWDPLAFEGKAATLNKALAIHFVREGRFDIAETFVAEAAHVHIPADLKSQFFEMFQIQEALRARDIAPAIQWAARRRADLEKRGSSLEFQLHKLQFVQHLIVREPHSALMYAKTNFGHFARHLKEIQQLMCAILFADKLSVSPYASLLNPHLWVDIQSSFSRDFCLLLGLSSDSPLFISVTAGTLALPTIIKMSSIMKDKSGLEWSQQGELPVEIPLLDTYRYHSVFACPVSKEQGSDENPPMMMLCGHIVCKESLARLSKGNANARFKCPYCPTESTASQASRVHF